MARNNQGMMMIRKFSEIINKPKHDCIYDVVSHLNLDLFVDIGAAAGHVTRRICLVGGENTRVVAFEPFPDNHQHFRQSTKDLNNEISLVKKAVSDKIGVEEFYVPSVVKGSEPDWEEYAGYSSVGFLSADSIANAPEFFLKTKLHIKSRLRTIKNMFHNRPRSNVLIVEVTTIENELPNEVIDFMKIDVQGAEEKVLLGAHSLLHENKIHVLYIEWSGEQKVVNILVESGYEIFDSTYIIGPRVHDTKPFEEIGFQLINEVNLSTGKIAYEMIIADEKVSPSEAIKEVQKRELGWIQTDLIVVSKKMEEQFVIACKKYSEQQANKAINASS